MGAWGSWNLALAHPDMFAALVPIAGFVDRVPMIESCKLKDTPIRIFHGLQDDVVNVDYSIDIFNKLKNAIKILSYKFLMMPFMIVGLEFTTIQRFMNGC